MANGTNGIPLGDWGVGRASGNIDLAPSMTMTEVVKVIQERIDNIEPPVAIIKCQHCDQWAAAYTICHQCGGPTSRG